MYIIASKYDAASGSERILYGPMTFLTQRGEPIFLHELKLGVTNNYDGLAAFVILLAPDMQVLMHACR